MNLIWRIVISILLTAVSVYVGTTLSEKQTVTPLMYAGASVLYSMLGVSYIYTLFGLDQLQ